MQEAEHISLSHLRERVKDSYFLNYLQYSDLDQNGIIQTTAKFDEINKNIGDLPPDPWEAVLAIRDFLIEQGFHYDQRSIKADEVLIGKKGNCLSLTLLIGSILEKRGYSHSYRLALNIRDPVSRFEQKRFRELLEGSEFKYDYPKPPEVKADDPPCHFAPLEHPQILIGNKVFDATDLDQESRESADYDSELFRDVNFLQLLSCLLIDRAKYEYGARDKVDFIKVNDLIKKGLELWPQNREAIDFFRDVALEFFDDAAVEEAEKQYAGFTDNDSRYFYNMYIYTRREEYLDKALEKYPAHIQAFTAKTLLKDAYDRKELAFNLAVAAHCYATSEDLDLGKFYMSLSKKLSELFGGKLIERLIKKNAVEELNKPDYYLALFEATGNKSYLAEIIKRKLSGETPMRQMILLNILCENSMGKKYCEEFQKLYKKYSSTTSFKKIFDVKIIT